MNTELTTPADQLKNKFFSLQEPSDVADMLEVPYKVLMYIVYRKPLHLQYKRFEIKKRLGGERVITAPRSSIKILQQKLNYVLRLIYRPKACVHGYVNGRDIRSNARIHANKRWVYNVDLLNFFPSINFGRVRGMFMKYFDLPDACATVLAQICCYNNELPQGAPTSPIISNMICAVLDRDLMYLAKSSSCSYTRYADDIVFSTTKKNFPHHITSEIQRIVEQNGFSINPKKVRLSQYFQRQEVTGLTVNKFPNVRRQFIKEVRAVLNVWEKYGPEEAQQFYRTKYGIENRNPVNDFWNLENTMKGKINYIRMVRGESNSIYQKLADRYNKLVGSGFPVYNRSILEAVSPSLWVLESDEELEQGTGFMLNGVGLVTCAHVVKKDTVAYRTCDTSKKYSVKTSRIHPLRDFAILSIDYDDCIGLEPSFDEGIEIGKNIILVGYPNYQVGDTPYIQNGAITMERKVRSSGIEQKRFMISASIIYGNSGGPVLNESGKVIGIAVTGQPSLVTPSHSDRTEKHGVIPIGDILIPVPD
ncbi:reverse transcriptase domain-containing protein [Alicyclobacillus dauci]|uniref:RNA-directed DNA polymerase n=1 Tax=Alicyclobacillus dauci TaxID=1475485 RepID=A0ABY6Z6S8_9BACL|nr:reverse transcriptase domain-containing protein [Alicyclobacillus dauci]WAH38603.1 reverse transcriptase domain-containing protein [Alicyclobacillus dauci]